MEKKCTSPQQFDFNFKHLPPIDPATTTQYQMDKPTMKYVPKDARAGPTEELKLAKKFDDEANTKADLLADVNLSHNINTEDDSLTIIKKTRLGEIINDDKASLNDSAGPKVSPKSQLLQTCAANKWKFPVFECCKEEGPCHKKLFTYRVVMEIEGESIGDLECFGDPKSKKKTAAESAAEGALWFLKHMGYFPINQVRRKRKK